MLPGRIVRHDWIEPLGLTVTAAARALGVSRQALNNLVNLKAGISPEMAIRRSKAFGSSPEVWLGLQIDYDLARAEKDAGGSKSGVSPRYRTNCTFCGGAASLISVLKRSAVSMNGRERAELRSQVFELWEGYVEGEIESCVKKKATSKYKTRPFLLSTLPMATSSARAGARRDGQFETGSKRLLTAGEPQPEREARLSRRWKICFLRKTSAAK